MTQNQTTPGKILWADLTVPHAEIVRDFYQAVVGWDSLPEDMGCYDDYHMLLPGTGQPVAGICQVRGVNADLPSVWSVYVTVADLAASVQRCLEMGGKVLVEPRRMGPGKIAVIQDPAEAIAAHYEQDV